MRIYDRDERSEASRSSAQRGSHAHCRCLETGNPSIDDFQGIDFPGAMVQGSPD